MLMKFTVEILNNILRLKHLQRYIFCICFIGRRTAGKNGKITVKAW